MNVCPAVDDQGQYFGHTRRLKLGLFERMTLVWTCLETDGKITQVGVTLITLSLYLVDHGRPWSYRKPRMGCRYRKGIWGKVEYGSEDETVF